MKAIKRKNFIFAALTSVSILAGVMFLLFGGGVCEIQAQIFLVGVIIASAIAAGLWVRGLRKLKIVRLIAENPILHIRTAVISDLSAEAKQLSNTVNTEVIVSYFGILLDEKVIKFNQGGIRIRAAKIGGDFISFTYGTEKRTKNIRILRPAIDSAELDQIVEKFRYETGITPTLEA